MYCWPPNIKKRKSRMLKVHLNYIIYPLKTNNLRYRKCFPHWETLLNPERNQNLKQPFLMVTNSLFTFLLKTIPLVLGIMLSNRLMVSVYLNVFD